MTESRETYLRYPLEGWLEYAISRIGMSYEEAKCLWLNTNCKNKYLIAEAENDSDTRLYVRDVSHGLFDAQEDRSWVRMFTITREPVTKGLWICKIMRYKLDRGGHIFAEVQGIKKIRCVYYDHGRVDPESYFNSMGWWYFFHIGKIFIPEYDFTGYFSHTPNISELLNRFPEFSTLNQASCCYKVFQKYIRDEITIESITNCLETLGPWDLAVYNAYHAVRSGSVTARYSKKYPILSEKLTKNFIMNSHYSEVTIYDIDEYFGRQNQYYHELVMTDKMGQIEDQSAIEDRIEAALKYRKEEKLREKEEKKAERKKKKEQ
jgi:hypothetical protein